jgi:hypothetical protein
VQQIPGTLPNFLEVVVLEDSKAEEVQLEDTGGDAIV